MKKSAILGLVAALFMGQSALAQSNQEVSYVEDPAQGYILNSFSNNWFISVEGGMNYYFRHDNSERNFFNRFAPNAGFWVGKWFSPIVGLRGGLNFTQVKGIYNPERGGVGYYAGWEGDKVRGKRNEFGLNFDAMVNLTNWWCGYRPGRVYNGILYGGAGMNVQYIPDFKSNGERDGWTNGHNKNLTAHVGLINNFALNKHVSLYLDLRGVVLTDDIYRGATKQYMDLQAYLGLTYNFNKSTWSAPVVPVCPPAANCDEVEARLQAANARISDLERQLRDCLNRPVEKVEAKEGPLCTIYYTIGNSRLSRVDNKVLGAVAEVMKANPNQKYTVTGWADNYTGSDQVNDRLRHARANGVEKVLLRNGVNPSQLDVTVNNGNLNDMGEKFVSLDRAVTIEADK